MNSAPGQVGHVVCPPLLSTKITLTSGGNTNRWAFYGTRKQILNGFVNMYVYDQEQTYADYIKSYFVDIYDVERVKVEIRPRIDSKDSMITTLNRVVVASGSKFSEIVDELETEWFKPAQSYAQQTVQLFSDAPAPNVILSAKPPTSIQITEEDTQPSHAYTEPEAAH
ncbi:unnamed protein product [Mucor hiemalis]